LELFLREIFALLKHFKTSAASFLKKISTEYWQKGINNYKELEASFEVNHKEDI
jgi:hypothetical protein